jgi:hypothetical protein
MKKFIPFLILLNLALTSFGQMKRQVPILTSDEYMEKSKKQNTAAWIMLGGGTALFIIGRFIIPPGESVGNYASAFGAMNENDGLKLAIAGPGLIAMIAGPLTLIESGRNKKRAMAVSIKINNAPQLQKNSLVQENIPSLNLKISL